MVKFLRKWLFPPLGISVTVTAERDDYGSVTYMAEALLNGNLYRTYSWNKKDAVRSMKQRLKEEKATQKVLEAGPEKFDV